MNFATPEDFLSVADKTLKPYFEIQTINVEYSQELIDAFRDATTLISRAIQMPVHVNVLIGNSPFKIEFRTNRIEFHLGENVLGHSSRGVIFLCVGKLLRCDNQIERIVVVLEEFVHSMLNVRNEFLARTIVAALFPVVRATKDDYELVPESEQPREPLVQIEHTDEKFS